VDASTSLMPAAFLGHGSPMNALETNRYTAAWRRFGEGAPRPRGIVVVSAHWYVPFTAVTAMERPRTIHDFSGFPEELLHVDYPAPGDPLLGEEVADLCEPTRVGLDRDGWGLDHGTWSVLLHAFPKADVPVVQLSIDAREGFDHHLELGAKLAALRRSGVIVVASGNVVHNLRALDWSRADFGFDWTRRFDEAARAALTGRTGDVLGLAGHPDFPRAVPTPDHFVPLLYFAGLATAGGETAQVLVDGYAFGSLSMAAYTLPASPEDRPRRGPHG
jgi:4,5-DOPA dioxygenase extradiol